MAEDERERVPIRRSGCFLNALNAAELAAKALLVKAIGQHPREHQVAGTLAKHGLVPADLDERELYRLMARYFEPRYDLETFFTDDELDDAIASARSLITAARRYPGGSFHPPRRAL